MSFSSKTLNFYIFVTFFKWLLGMLLGLSFVIFLVELVEGLRRAASAPDVTFVVSAYISLLRVPELLLEILPILVLFAVIGTLWWRSRSQELIIARATGLSLWQFLKPIVLTSLLVGAFAAALFNPLSLKSSQKLKQLEEIYFSGSGSEPVLRVSATGVWLKEELVNGAYRLVRARQVEQFADHSNLKDVDVFIVDQNSSLLLSWHAELLVFSPSTLDAELGGRSSSGLIGQMKLTGVVDQTDPAVPNPVADQLVETKLSMDSFFRQNLNSNEVNFWEIPKLIEQLTASGLPFGEVQLKYFKLVSLPLTLVSMVMLAALFSLRMTRSGGVGQMILAGVSIALLLHFLTDILYSFALAGNLPTLLSVLTVPVALVCVCSFFLLEQEDG